ncbi:restriction endonuclease subunit S [Clostridium pasteurianum]|nr:restriction endonuclease subunit S [Clostridium pasteurianum]
MEYKSRFIGMFGDPINNPMGWEVKKLKNISTKILSGNTPKGGSEVYVDEGIMFFRSQNVWKNKLVLDDIAYIDKETHNKMLKSSLKNRDILMTKTGRINTENSSLGRAAMFIGEDDSANINGHVYLIRLQDGEINEFVLFILTTNEYRDYIRSVCVGGIDKRQINKEHLEEFPIIYPPLELQNQFAAFVNQVDKLKFEFIKETNTSIFTYHDIVEKFIGGLNVSKKI